VTGSTAFGHNLAYYSAFKQAISDLAYSGKSIPNTAYVIKGGPIGGSQYFFVCTSDRDRAKEEAVKMGANDDNGLNWKFHVEEHQALSEHARIMEDLAARQRSYQEVIAENEVIYKLGRLGLTQEQIEILLENYIVEELNAALETGQSSGSDKTEETATEGSDEPTKEYSGNRPIR
jgi:hypothetical protein